MAKYKHKTSGGIIEVIIFDESIESIERVISAFFGDLHGVKYDYPFKCFYADSKALTIPLSRGSVLVKGGSDNGYRVGVLSNDYFYKNYELAGEPVEPAPMSTNDQLSAFAGEVWKVVERFMDEFDIPLAGAVGVLEVVKMEILLNERESHEGDS